MCVSILNGFLDYNALLAEHTVTFVLVSKAEHFQTKISFSLSEAKGEKMLEHLEGDCDLTV